MRLPLGSQHPGAVRVEVLAQRIGVTRGGFYRQFGGRAELVDAMLDAGTAIDAAEVMRWVGRICGDEDPRYRRIATVLTS